ncbi:MAG TPA: hypothetical protein VGH03_05295 [Caulobacteraceae bacterium]|jgi:antitoxin component of MazEF toxin-antitoxin module
MANQIGIEACGQAEVLADGDCLIVCRAAARWTLDDVLANITPEAMRKAFDWGDNAGRERIED